MPINRDLKASMEGGGVFTIRRIPDSPKPDSPKLGLGVGVFPIRRNLIHRNYGLGLGLGLGFRVRV